MSSNPFASFSKFPEAIKRSKLGQWTAFIMALTALVGAMGVSANQILETYMKHHPDIKKVNDRMTDIEEKRNNDREIDILTMQIISDQVNYNSVIICKLNNGAPHKTFPCDGLRFHSQPLTPNPNSPLFQVNGDEYPYQSKGLSVKLK